MMKMQGNTTEIDERNLLRLAPDSDPGVHSNITIDNFDSSTE